MRAESLPGKPRFLLAAVAIVCAAGCASAQSRLFQSGMDAYHRKDWARATDDLSGFTTGACNTPPGADARCQTALTHCGRALAEAGRFAEAWTTLTAAFSQPEERDAPSAVEIAKVRAKLLEQLSRATEHGTLELRYRDETPDGFIPSGAYVQLDFKTLLGHGHDQSNLRAGWRPLFSGRLPAGDHLLEVVAYERERSSNAPPPGVYWHRMRSVRVVTIKPNELTALDLRMFLQKGTFLSLPHLEFEALPR